MVYGFGCAMASISGFCNANFHLSSVICTFWCQDLSSQSHVRCDSNYTALTVHAWQDMVLPRCWRRCSIYHCSLIVLVYNCISFDFMSLITAICQVPRRCTSSYVKSWVGHAWVYHILVLLLLLHTLWRQDRVTP